MYGLVNRAVEQLVRRRYGEAAWETIREQAGVGSVPFVAMEAYPDDVTYRLVEAASRVLGIPAEQVLEAFGEHWVLYTAQEGYGDLLAMGGRSFREFLLHLHDLHGHVMLTFPHLKPPSIWCIEETPGRIRLHYQSPRQGLVPMVVGLLRGLGKLYQTPITVRHDRRKDAGADHDEFVVEFPSHG